MILQAIDFSRFLRGSESDRVETADALVESFKQHGFARLVNYGISVFSIEHLEMLNRKFFSMPEDAKMRSFKGAETTAGLRKHKDVPDGILVDEKEHFDAGSASDMDFPNKWPDKDMPELRQFLEPFHDTCQDLCLSLMEACELGLRLPPGTLTRRCQPPASELRLNYYPAVDMKKLQDGRTRRTWPHTDFGLLTLLWQDDVGGLKYQDRSKSNSRSFMERQYGTGHSDLGVEQDVFLPLTRNEPGEMAVNISDTFQRLTNDVFRAGVHTVDWPDSSSHSRKERTLPARYSSVFFFKAHRNTSVGVLPHFITEQTPAHYDNITALEFHRRMTQVLIDPTGQK
ncbi:iron/ascorbate family oxidoreductase [Tothia fuscella]|uniref:Iron/ascorbate family oxidoreductase n=1 Tax=Tothia fuscella TaxID=1048955 RepID=A0A9P4TTI8_9PEZI|nr:iron/ascorbate family oxidoreductase [Tothia fuscella]